MADDLSAYSDEELEAIAGGSATTADLSSVSDEELERIAGASDVAEPIETQAEESTQVRGAAESAARGAARSTLLGSFADEAYGLGGATAYGVAKGVRALLPGGVPEGAPGVADVYRQIKGQYNQGDAEADPLSYGAGAAGGIAAQIGPRNIVNILKAAPTAIRNSPAILRGLFTKEAGLGLAKGTVAGAGYGSLSGLGSSDADLTQGQFGEAAQDTLGGAIVGGALGGGLGSLTGAFRGGLAAKAGETDQAAETIRKAQALKEPSRDKAVSLLGLESKQNRLGGPERTRQIAQKLYDEPFPDGSGRTWVQRMDSQDPESGLQFIKKFREATGADLGAIREELASNARAAVPAEVLRSKFRDALGRLPNDVQGKVLQEVDGIVAKVTDEAGNVPAAGLRKAIENIEDAADLDTSNLSTLLGKKASRTILKLRGVAVDEEKALVAAFAPDKREAYSRLLDQFSNAKAVELGATAKLDRLNRNKPPIRHPTPGPELRQELSEVLRRRSPLGRQIMNSIPVLGPVGRRIGEAAAPGLFQSVKPTTAMILGEAKEAQAAKDQLSPLLEQLLNSGPRGAAILQAILAGERPRDEQP